MSNAYCTWTPFGVVAHPYDDRPRRNVTQHPGFCLPASAGVSVIAQTTWPGWERGADAGGHGARVDAVPAAGRGLGRRPSAADGSQRKTAGEGGQGDGRQLTVATGLGQVLSG